MSFLSDMYDINRDAQPERGEREKRTAWEKVYEKDNEQAVFIV